MYRYELVQAEQIVATGYLTEDEQLEVGDQIAIGGRVGIVRTIEPLLGERELRLVAQVRRSTT